MTKPAFAICKQQSRSSVHPCSLISAIVVSCLDSILPLVSISELSSLYLASLAAQTGLCLTWSQTPKTGFLVTRLIRNKINISAHSRFTEKIPTNFLKKVFIM